MGSMQRKVPVTDADKEKNPDIDITIVEKNTTGYGGRANKGGGVLDGTFYIIKAKAVIICTSSQSYRVAPMWSNGRGDGTGMAYRAGAEMRNPEFGTFTQLFKKNAMHECVYA
ncbi:MAG: FAD-binding protein [Lachnospiraceae bacterium]|nr:FAD-binding protein [Lachnospiraceae bacterium]